MKVEEAIRILSNADDVYSIWIAEQYIDGTKVVDCQDLDEHRWYSIATSVYELEDGYLGVRGPFQSFSEMQDWADILASWNGKMEYFEMEPIPSIQYVRKK